MIRKLCLAVTLCVSMAFAQSTGVPNPAAFDTSRAFEVTSIRQNVAGGKVSAFGPTPDGFRMVNTSLGNAIRVAYVPQTGGALYWDMAGAPSWLSQNRYDIEARIAEADRAEWQKPGAQTKMLQAMLQTLLAERCKLVIHRERKDAAVFYLEVAKGGPRMQESKNDEPLRPSRLPGGGTTVMENGSMRFYQAPMTLLASMLSNRNLGGPEIQDRTGLNGRYDFVVEWGAWTGGMQAADDTSDPGPTLSSSVAKLGLKLIPAKGQVETLVIDHIEKPTDN
jgi:bla regulator protein BlaR1